MGPLPGCRHELPPVGNIDEAVALVCRDVKTSDPEPLTAFRDHFMQSAGYQGVLQRPLMRIMASADIPKVEDYQMVSESVQAMLMFGIRIGWYLCLLNETEASPDPRA